MPSEFQDDIPLIFKLTTARRMRTQTAGTLDKDRPRFFSPYLGVGFRYTSPGTSLRLGYSYSDGFRRFVWKDSVLVSTTAATTPTPVDYCPQPILGVGHPTIKDFEHASQVLGRFCSQFRYPQPDEGYDNILYLKPSDHPSPHWSSAEIAAVLSRLEESVPRGRRVSDGGAVTAGSS